MIYAIKKDELKDLEELDELQTKVKTNRLVRKLGIQGFHYDVNELFELLTGTFKNTSEDIRKTIT